MLCRFIHVEKLIVLNKSGSTREFFELRGKISFKTDVLSAFPFYRTSSKGVLCPLQKNARNYQPRRQRRLDQNHRQIWHVVYHARLCLSWRQPIKKKEIRKLNQNLCLTKGSDVDNMIFNVIYDTVIFYTVF